MSKESASPTKGEGSYLCSELDPIQLERSLSQQAKESTQKSESADAEEDTSEVVVTAANEQQEGGGVVQIDVPSDPFRVRWSQSDGQEGTRGKPESPDFGSKAMGNGQKTNDIEQTLGGMSQHAMRAVLAMLTAAVAKEEDTILDGANGTSLPEKEVGSGDIAFAIPTSQLMQVMQAFQLDPRRKLMGQEDLENLMKEALLTCQRGTVGAKCKVLLDVDLALERGRDRHVVSEQDCHDMFEKDARLLGTSTPGGEELPSSPQRQHEFGPIFSNAHSHGNGSNDSIYVGSAGSPDLSLGQAKLDRTRGTADGDGDSRRRYKAAVTTLPTSMHDQHAPEIQCRESNCRDVQDLGIVSSEHPHYHESLGSLSGVVIG